MLRWNPNDDNKHITFIYSYYTKIIVHSIDYMKYIVFNQIISPRSTLPIILHPKRLQLSPRSCFQYNSHFSVYIKEQSKI